MDDFKLEKVADEEMGKNEWEVTEEKARDSEEQGGTAEVVVVDVFPEGGWRACGAVTGAVLVLLSTFG